MSRLSILPDHLRTIHQHAEASYPEECCGFLIGRASGETTEVERVLPAGNQREDSRHNRYLIHPETVLAAHKEARGLGLDVIGYYHSHPDHPSRPSDFDREHAWPGLSYLIVSVQGGRVADERSWRLTDERDRFDEERIDQRFEKEAV